MLRHIFLLFAILSLSVISGCTNIGGASKSATSLTNFLGFSELPSWYITSRYTYPDSQFRTNDFGLPVHFRDVGEGDTIVLLHGELSSVHTWERWIEILRQEFRVIAIDLPGAGITGAPKCVSNPKKQCPENLSQDYITHTITYLIEDLELRNFHLVGASYGGYLASRYAISNPDRIKSLTLISPLGLQQDPPFMIDYLADTNMVTQFFQPATIATTIADDFYGSPERITQASLQRYLHLLQAPGAKKTNVLQAAIINDLMLNGTTESFSDIKAPSLIMWGNRDKWGRFEHAQRWVDTIPNSMLVEYKGIGHLSMEEHADDSAYDLIAFINDEPLPTIEGLGRDAFTIQDAVDSLGDKEALFGPNLDIMEDVESE